MDALNILPDYSSNAPSNQTAVDIFKGHWVSAFPAEANAKAGESLQFDPLIDTRVQWVSNHFDFQSKRVLELGPLEGYHTKHLCDRGANVVAIESNDIAYLKCLVAKEILQIPARFLFGDGTAFLKSKPGRYDFIWSSGILYHQKDPLEFLNLICDHCNAFFIWTHYWEKGKVAEGLNFDPKNDSNGKIGNFTASYHYHGYGDKHIAFSGGLEQYSIWMERREILSFVEAKGFQIVIEQDFPDVFPGPCTQFFAHKA